MMIPCFDVDINSSVTTNNVISEEMVALAIANVVKSARYQGKCAIRSSQSLGYRAKT
jgi:hypothetical protein